MAIDVKNDNARGVQVTSVFEALSNDRRRYVLHYLSRRGRADARDVVEFVRDVDPDAKRDDTDALAIELHHTHLPKLHDFDIVEYDPRGETVRFRDTPLVEACLDEVEDCDLP